MSTFWNQIYAQKEYVYGTKPNEFYKEELLKLKPGKILFPAEGEGRNSVFAALNGWNVVAFDNSEVAIEKAKKLAIINKVNVNYLLSSYDEFEFEENSFDALVLIYAHMPERNKVHEKLIRYIKPGGILILEAFSKEQLKRNTGGPRNIDLLFSKEELIKDFSSLKELKIEEKEINLGEGRKHSGISSILRVIGKK